MLDSKSVEVVRDFLVTGTKVGRMLATKPEKTEVETKFMIANLKFGLLTMAAASAGPEIHEILAKAGGSDLLFDVLDSSMDLINQWQAEYPDPEVLSDLQKEFASITVSATMLILVGKGVLSPIEALEFFSEAKARAK